MELAAEIFENENTIMNGMSGDLMQLLIRFALNFVVIGIIIYGFYYQKSKRRDYTFTFVMIAVSVFFLIFLLGSVKLKIGFALGVFAIFGIIRYRTESMAIREMTYLFTIIAISVINGLSVQIDYPELLTANLIFILAIFALECSKQLKHISSKIILYDNIHLIVPEKEEELKQDLHLRTGLDIVRVEIGRIDFLRDSALLKVYYESAKGDVNTAESISKISDADETL
ncbi:MAG: DUF4956 domain-containing protein [Mangrovibacterium sp.]